MAVPMNDLDRAAIDLEEAGPLMRQAAYASIAVALMLIAFKFGAGLFTNSVAILSSLVDSVLDLVASTINLIAIRQALQPADKRHRFGHGKAESLGALVQGAIIIGSAAFVLFEAASRLIVLEPVTAPALGIGVMGFSIVMTLGLVAYQRYVIKKTGSSAISADALHYKGDVLINLSVMVAIVLSSGFGIHYADPIFAIGIALYLGWAAVRIIRGSLGVLMDQELGDKERATIKKMVLGVNGVRDLHDLRTRSSGPQVFIQFHIDLERNISLLDAHEISDDIEDLLLEKYPGAEVIIHADPEGIDERRDAF
ncbi:MAG: cation diffusion facilitator family transporter [Alphaproteobacteria bacterium]